MRVRILGKYYTLRFVPNLGPKHQPNDGDCNHPNDPDKEIRIKSGLPPADTLETVIHEVLHAANWHLDEEFVTDFARDVTRILKRKQIWERICGED